MREQKAIGEEEAKSAVILCCWHTSKWPSEEMAPREDTS